MIQTTAPALLAALNGAASKMAAPKKDVLPILAAARIEDGAVTVTDLGIQGTQRFAAVGAGTFILERAALKKILSKIGDAAIVLTTRDDGAAAITLANGSAFTLAQPPASDWPEPFAEPAADHVDLDAPADTLRNMLERALAACSKDATRPVLAAICIAQHPDGFEVVATDSYRLHILGYGDVSRTDNVKTTLLPRAFAEAIVERIKKLKPARVTLRGDNPLTGNRPVARVVVGDWTGACRVTQGQYPNYRALIPDADAAAGTAILPAAATIAALDLAEATNQRNAPICLTLGPSSSLSIDAHASIAFSAPLDVLYAIAGTDREPREDEGMTIGYNAAFLGDLIAASQSDAPILSVISPLRPSWLTSVGCAQCGTPIDGHGVSFHGLIMPIRLS